MAFAEKTSGSIRVVSLVLLKETLHKTPVRLHDFFIFLRNVVSREISIKSKWIIFA